MPATVIAERSNGPARSPGWENVRRLRPEHRPVDPADRLSWAPGDAAQCDLWFPPRKIPLEDGGSVLLPVLVMVAAHSRFITARMLPTRRTEDLLLGSWELIQRLGRVPRRLIWDNEPGIGQKGRLAQGVAAFAGTLATKVVQLRPYDPQSKGSWSAATAGWRPRSCPAARSPHPPTSPRNWPQAFDHRGRDGPVAPGPSRRTAGEQ
uniref:DDE-type integrase/transposase/recombinase n=1 Tax=Microbacterium ureisolvens TaxID=2781186 RepID=UPI0027E2CBDD|nr:MULTISPECIES: DDE-type integrase/transposase/recombinase [Microbacterium]